MDAFHTLCSRPKFEDKSIEIQDYKILCFILSALKWKKHNGAIKLVADNKSLDYIKKINIDFIWDFHLEELQIQDINYNMFWAGSKIFALKKQKSPIVMLDLDMIVFENINKLLENSVISTIHSENISDIYKPKEYFCMNEDYNFDEEFDWSVLPSNTALLYIKDEEFKNYYCDESIRFMKNADNTDDMLSYMIFAEQRLVSMCAKKKNIPINYLMKYPQDTMKQNTFSHIWGYKNTLDNDKYYDEQLCIRLAKRILNEFPRESLLLMDKQFFYKYI